MNAVLADNLGALADAAEQFGEDTSVREAFHFAFAGYRLFRNFTVLLAAGLLDFPKETAQALLTTSVLETKEAMPNIFGKLADLAEIIDITTLTEEHDFSEELLVYHDGRAVLKQVAGLDFEAVADDDTDEDDEDDEEIRCGCDQCNPEPENVERARQCEETWNRQWLEEHGAEPSPARQDLHRFDAMLRYNVPMTVEEVQVHDIARQLVVAERAAEIIRERAFRAQRAQQIDGDNAGRLEDMARAEAAKARAYDMAAGERMAERAVEPLANWSESNRENALLSRDGNVTDSQDEPNSAEAAADPNWVALLANTLVNLTEAERLLVNRNGGVVGISLLPLGNFLSLSLASGSRLVVTPYK